MSTVLVTRENDKLVVDRLGTAADVDDLLAQARGRVTTIGDDITILDGTPTQAQVVAILRRALVSERQEIKALVRVIEALRKARDII